MNKNMHKHIENVANIIAAKKFDGEPSNDAKQMAQQFNVDIECLRQKGANGDPEYIVMSTNKENVQKFLKEYFKGAGWPTEDIAMVHGPWQANGVWFTTVDWSE